MENEPTPEIQLIMRPPSYISYIYACKLGVGGGWCSGTLCMKPFLWQVEWPCDIQDSLVTLNKPNGSSTINDLELSGALLGFIVLKAQKVHLKHFHLSTFCDNMTTVVWA